MSDGVGVVTDLTLEKLDAPILVYNLDVADFDTYFVGDGVLVHNACGSGNRHTPDQEALVDLAQDAQKRGVSRENAETLVKWAEEYGFKPLIHWEGHAGGTNAVTQGPHFRIGPVNHIPIKLKALTSDRGSFEERRLYALALEARYSSSYFYSPFHELRRNGFAVIERTEPRGTYDPPYHGVARENDTFDWPLGVEDDVLSKALREEERQKWPKYLHDCDALAVVPDWPYILRYVEHCQDLKKIVDVYFLGEKLETFDADLKKADIAPYRAIHMGFDCMGALDLSYIYDDDAYTILEREQEKFRQIEQRLKAKGIRLKRRLRFNEHGLFYTAAEADWYAKLRRAAIYSGVFDFETEDGKGCGLECVPLEKVVRCAKIVLD